MKMLKKITAILFAAVIVAGTISPLTAEAAVKKPGNCRFAGWCDSTFTSCYIQWDAVKDADVYEILYSYTDGSHAKSDDSFKTTYRIKNLAYNHVYQVRVRAITVINKEIFIGPWSNIAFITPYPNKVSGKAIGTVSNPGMKINWNIIYGCNGYNVFLTTSPKGKWYWNQSTNTKATATSAAIKKYRGSKLKPYTNYYVRVVTRRKRNGVFCTVPVPRADYWQARFLLRRG